MVKDLEAGLRGAGKTGQRPPLKAGGSRVENGGLFRRPRNPVDATALLLTMTFCLAGCCLIPYPGLQMDEVLFGSAIYAPRLTPAWIGVFKILGVYPEATVHCAGRSPELEVQGLPEF